MSYTPLTDEQIRELVRAAGLMFTGPDMKIARAVEAAATAPLLARIAELEAALAEASKDAQRYRWLRDDAYSYFWTEQGGCYPRRALDAAIDSMKGTP